MASTTLWVVANTRVSVTSHDGIFLFVFMICFNKTDRMFYWKMGYECITTKLNCSFIVSWAPIGTDE